MRAAFSRLITECARKNPQAFLLTGDHGYALFDEFRKNCASQFINAGVAEQNMIGVAAGMAKAGLYPMVYGLSAFVPVRVLEQIKMDFCYEQLPGLIVGDGAGVVYSALGASHQSFEDISSLRGIPYITIYSPADAFELEACFEHALASRAPSYLRLGKADLAPVHQEKPRLDKRLLSVKKTMGNKHAIIATGSMVPMAQDLLSRDLRDFDLFSAPLLKPLDKNMVFEQLKDYDHLFTLEEHSIYGGLGSTIAEILSPHGGKKLDLIGIEDRFSELCGSYQYLMRYHGLDSESVLEKIKGRLKNP